MDTTTITNLLSDYITDYINDTVNYEIAQISKIASKFSSFNTKEEFIAEYLGKDVSVLKLPVKKDLVRNGNSHRMVVSDDQRITYSDCDSIWNPIKSARYAIGDGIDRTKKAIAEVAEKSFTTKVKAIIKKLREAGFSEDIYVGYIENSCKVGELEFYITDGIKVMDARLIYACGYIVKPHYRFITTIRKIKRER